MSMFFNEIAEVNRAHCAALGIKTDAYRVPGATNIAFRQAAHKFLDSMGAAPDPAPVKAIPRPDDFYAETTGGALAYDWIARCQRSEAEALKVLSEMDSQDDFMAKVFHMLSNVETRTDRSKVINELVESFEGALLAAANHE